MSKDKEGVGVMVGLTRANIQELLAGKMLVIPLARLKTYEKVDEITLSMVSDEDVASDRFDRVVGSLLEKN